MSVAVKDMESLDSGIPSSSIKTEDCCWYLFMGLEPLKSAYEDLPEGKVPETNVFSTQHNTNCAFCQVEFGVIPLMGYLPQDLIGSSIFDLYHPEDIPVLLEAHKEAIKTNGVPYKSQPIRMLPKNKSEILVETEWSSFINPWTKKLEFVLGRHTVISAPKDPNVFHEPENQWWIRTKQEEWRRAQSKQMEIRNLLANPECALVDQQEQPTDVAETPPAGAEPGPPVPAPSGKEQDHIFSKNKQKTQSSSCSKSGSSEGGITYEQFNYTQNIKRFLMSCPKTHSSGKSSEQKSRSPTDDDQQDTLSEDELYLEENIPVEMVPKPPSFGSSTKVVVCEQEQPEDLLPYSPGPVKLDIDLNEDKNASYEIIKENVETDFPEHHKPPSTVTAAIDSGTETRPSSIVAVTVVPGHRSLEGNILITMEEEQPNPTGAAVAAAAAATAAALEAASVAKVNSQVATCDLTCENLNIFNKIQEKMVMQQLHKDRDSFILLGRSGVEAHAPEQRRKRGHSGPSSGDNTKNRQRKLMKHENLQRYCSAVMPKPTLPNKISSTVQIATEPEMLQVGKNIMVQENNATPPIVHHPRAVQASTDPHHHQSLYAPGYIPCLLHGYTNLGIPWPQANVTPPQLCTGFCPSEMIFQPVHRPVAQQQNRRHHEEKTSLGNGIEFQASTSNSFSPDTSSSGFLTLPSHSKTSSRYPFGIANVPKLGNKVLKGSSKGTESTSVSTDFLLESDGSTPMSESAQTKESSGDSGTVLKLAEDPPWISAVPWNKDTMMRYQLQPKRLKSVLKSDRVTMETVLQPELMTSQFHQLLEDLENKIAEEMSLSSDSSSQGETKGQASKLCYVDCNSETHDHGVSNVMPETEAMSDSTDSNNSKGMVHVQKPRKSCSHRRSNTVQTPQQQQQQQQQRLAETKEALEQDQREHGEQGEDQLPENDEKDSSSKSDDGEKSMSEGSSIDKNSCDKMDGAQSENSKAESDKAVSSDLTPSDARSNEEEQNSSLKESDHSSGVENTNGKDPTEAVMDDVMSQLFVPLKARFPCKQKIDPVSPWLKDFQFTESAAKEYQMDMKTLEEVLAKDSLQMKQFVQPAMIGAQFAELRVRLEQGNSTSESPSADARKEESTAEKNPGSPFGNLFYPILTQMGSDGDAVGSQCAMSVGSDGTDGKGT
ncbi:period circadian protein homolog 3 [Lingula anatina]|uniref:Period circadian protein homolog 3 n=1 Tax=Lingula anatina TaxID=7574 RepID=A0A1S3I7Y4_LINAN|nr:period circadian protein homolog 3 [Lingula anatina]|eukprot:XP_013393971.1 period circadian protein homolog 3 [Lingula anatina]